MFASFSAWAIICRLLGTCLKMLSSPIRSSPKFFLRISSSTSIWNMTFMVMISGSDIAPSLRARKNARLSASSLNISYSASLSFLFTSPPYMEHISRHFFNAANAAFMYCLLYPTMKDPDDTCSYSFRISVHPQYIQTQAVYIT